ncbi:hypothetical protein Gohar_015672 [Gossypium harknessii]|uniref:Uncharacterized protein n=1 Tax=Gossypium harknessii TaxID=34285 RepID=A0A7J9G0I6_9ROSI|nr:hypothetical protein [Gossypium harknessii]
MALCKEIWTLVKYHRWERFCVTPKENTVIPVVQEFYASFRDQEMRKMQGEIWDTITVRGEEHVELQRKQIIGWNQRKKEKIDVPTVFKRKEQVTAWKGTTLNYPSDMFGPTQTHQGDEEKTSDEEDEVDEQEF